MNSKVKLKRILKFYGGVALNKSTVKLFYSYCHKDESYREKMEVSLSVLRQNGLLKEWHDRMILPGQHLSKAIRKQIEGSDIVVFLVSPDFLNSPACTEEWHLAKSMVDNGGKRLCSVILRDCAWKDFDDMSDYLVLPRDGISIANWENQDSVWMSVYDEIQSVIEDINKTFEVRQEIKDNLSSIEFCSQTQEQISLSDLFCIPSAVCFLQR